MSAIVKLDGTVRQLGGRAEPDEIVEAEDATDVDRLTRLLTRVLKKLAELGRAKAPTFLDFEDVAIDGTGTTLYRFVHNFGTRVRWWAVDWSGATEAVRLVRQASSDANVLVLVSYEAGTVTLRVEAVG